MRKDLGRERRGKVEGTSKGGDLSVIRRTDTCQGDDHDQSFRAGMKKAKVMGSRSVLAQVLDEGPAEAVPRKGKGPDTDNITIGLKGRTSQYRVRRKGLCALPFQLPRSQV